MRDLRLDALRGACLVAMTTAHLACCTGPAWVLTHPLLVVDAALGFVAVSGVVLGLTSRQRRRTGRLLRRAAGLYAAHLVLLVVGYALRDLTGQPAFLKDPDQLGGWPVLLRDSVLLLHTGTHLDILPLYVVLLLLAPLALRALAAGRTGALLAVAGTGWALTLLLGAPPLPAAGMTFGWTAWQLPFLLGVTAGWHADRLRALPHRRWAVGASTALVAAVATVAHLEDRTSLLTPAVADALATTFRKSPPGPGAMLLLPAAAVVAFAAASALRRTRLIALLALLGQHALSSYLLLTAVVVWLPPVWVAGPVWERTLLALSTLALLVLQARFRAARAARARAAPTRGVAVSTLP